MAVHENPLDALIVVTDDAGSLAVREYDDSIEAILARLDAAYAA